jgi:DNA-binding NarL/FixJ family response regulator
VAAVLDAVHARLQLVVFGLEGADGLDRHGRQLDRRKGQSLTAQLVLTDPPRENLLNLLRDEACLRARLGMLPPEMRYDAVSTCESALALIAAGRPFHGLVVDASLPDGSGLAMLDRWTAAHPEAPAVIITGHHDDPDIARFACRTSYRYLPKPFTKQDLAPFVADVYACRWKLPSPVIERFLKFAHRHRLSGRRMDLLARLMRGEPRKQIAVELDVAVSTVRTLQEQLLERIGVTTVDRAYEAVLRE